MNAWDRIAATLASEFSDVADLESFIRVVLRLLIAALLGGLLGLQREQHGKEAGVRTHMLVALGSALFVLVPLQAGAAAGRTSAASSRASLPAWASSAPGPSSG